MKWVPTTMKTIPSPHNGSATSSPPDTSPPGMSTSAALPMSAPPISPATPNAISSPASAGGLTSSGSLAGPTTDPSGPAPVPVSRFRARDSAKAMPTNDTSGPLFTHSSPSADLQRSLENRLRASLDVNGSPVFALTWRVMDMPSGLPILQLRASAHSTLGSGFIGWPTPCVVEPDTPAEKVWERKQRLTEKTGIYRGNDCGLGSKAQLAAWPTPQAHDQHGAKTQEQRAKQQIKGGCSNLNEIAQLAAWPSPQARDGAHSRSGQIERTGGRRRNLDDYVVLAGWPTPMAGTPATESYNEAGNTGSSRKTVALAAWATPTASEKRRGEDFQEGRALNALEALGPKPTGSTVGTASAGQLNPAHSRWLMGYPAEWDACAPTATRSSRKSRRSSFPPSRETNNERGV